MPDQLTPPLQNPEQFILLLLEQNKLQQEYFEGQLENLKKQNEQYRQAYDTLQQQVKQLLRDRFGTRSEKFIDPEHPQQDMFGGLAKQSAPSNEADIEVPAHQRKKRKKKDASNCPRVVVVIPVEPQDRHCDGCGLDKTFIRYETKELFDYKPAVFQIVEQRREVVGCTKGCEGSITTAAAPAHVLPKVRATESLLAHVVVSKCHDRQPLYHLEKYARAVDVSRETMARWMIALKTPLTPIYNLLKDQLIEHDIASIDATGLQVLKEPGRKPTTKSYVYCARGGPPDKSVVLYAYNDKEHKKFVDEWFEGFQGTIHMDADPFFNQLLQDEQVNESFCNAHARRYFEKVKVQAKKQGLAHEALRYYKKLYKIERQAKEQNMSPEQRYQLRQEKSKPILEEFKQWLDDHVIHVLPGSGLGKAFNYAIKHWQGLIQFLDDGRLEIDNNLTEQEVKPFVIARKNFMFATSVEGAHALCLHFTLIRTALLHNLDPYQYYTAVLKRLPHCKTVEDYEALLPWNIKLD